MIKRKISLVIVFMMVMSLMIPTFAFGAKKDYSGHWAEDTIDEWYEKDYVIGYEDGSFKPDQTITRAEFMKMVNKAFDYTEKGSTNFEDVESDDWFYQDVQKAVKAGYIIGYEDNTARPGNKITRQEAALMIARVKDLDSDASEAKIFTDYGDIATWARGGVGAVAEIKLMIGYEDGEFRPDRFISRAEALVTIDRAMEETPPVDEDEDDKGGSGGGGKTPVTTPAAILFNGEEIEFVNNSFTTTASAIITSSSITITTYDGEDVSVAVTTNSSITGTAIEVTTSAAIDGGIDHIAIVPLEVGENIITIMVGNEEYIITVTKQEE